MLNIPRGVIVKLKSKPEPSTIPANDPKVIAEKGTYGVIHHRGWVTKDTKKVWGDSDFFSAPTPYATTKTIVRAPWLKDATDMPSEVIDTYMWKVPVDYIYVKILVRKGLPLELALKIAAPLYLRHRHALLPKELDSTRIGDRMRERIRSRLVRETLADSEAASARVYALLAQSNFWAEPHQDNTPVTHVIYECNKLCYDIFLPNSTKALVLHAGQCGLDYRTSMHRVADELNRVALLPKLLKPVHIADRLVKLGCHIDNDSNPSLYWGFTLDEPLNQERRGIRESMSKHFHWDEETAVAKQMRVECKGDLKEFERRWKEYKGDDKTTAVKAANILATSLAVDPAYLAKVVTLSKDIAQAPRSSSSSSATLVF